MEPFLQIAPHSLAIVLSRVGAGEASGAARLSESDAPPRHHIGYEIFADFKAENTQKHARNQRITEALSDTFFLGWIDEHVLLIQGKEDHLEELREGWMRRSLNPPRGFTIKYLGVPTPTEEVLHHTLSMLVREQKIYPIVDGYFIVTPQTYFITPSLIRSSSKWYHLDERSADRRQHQSQQQPQQTQCTSPLSGTVTPSTSGGVRERTHPTSSQNHSGGGGDSFHNNSYRGDDPPSHHTSLQRRSPKGHREMYSLPHSPQTPPQQAGGNAEKSRSTLGFPFKTDTLTKHRGGAVGVGGGGGGGTGDVEKQAGGSSTGSRKFGLKLFRLSFKKDKTKQLATFSAQFPPEEWPLRDEEVPNQLPRHIEMELIRRINPDLTVENLVRHTAVMKRLEEERAQRSKASSANANSRSRRSGGRQRKQTQAKVSSSHSKTRASRGEPGVGSHLELAERDYRGYSSSLARSPRDKALAMERQRARLHLAHSNPNILDSSHLPGTPEWDVSGELAKRRTEMPFPEPSHGPSAHSKVHRSHSHTQERKSRNERSVKAKERSRSMDNSKRSHGAGLIGPSDYYENLSLYYNDDGTLRANQSSSHHSCATTPLTKVSSDTLGLDGSRTLDKNKSRDGLPAYLPKLLPASIPSDDFFQCSGSSEAILSPSDPLGTLDKNNHDGLKAGITDRQTDRQTPHLPENKEDLPKVGPKGGSLPPIPLSISDTPLSNGRSPHSASSGQEKLREIFSKDTLFKPPPSLPLPGYSSLRKPKALASSALSSSCDALDSQEDFDAPKPLVATPVAPPQGTEPISSAAEASYDYYNVSDDEELEEAGAKSRTDEMPGGSVAKMRGGGSGTMQWLLEREKERDLQRRFERTLTFPGAKENLSEANQNQQSSHSARLDSMDSSSVTVDSGFNSPRTRESLASNTSSIMESNRRQNLALSPSLSITTGGGPPFSFRILEPAGSQPEKLQKPSTCLASITSV